MDRATITQLLENVIFLDTGKMKLCGRQKCIDLLVAIQKYSEENNLNIPIENIGDMSSGKIHIKEVMEFHNDFLRE